MKILFVNNYYIAFLRHFYKQHQFSLKETTFQAHKRILFNQLFSVSDFYSRGVCENGHQAIDLVANDWILQGKWASEHALGIRTIPPIFPNTRIGQQFFLRGWMEKILWEQILEYKPDVCYFFNIENFSEDFLLRLKQDHHIIACQKASPVLSFKNYESADVVFSALPSLVDVFNKKHIHSHYLPFAFDPKVLQKVHKPKKKYECTFVGGFTKIHSRGNAVLLELSEKVHIDMFGYGKKMLPPGSNALRHHHGEIWGKDMYSVLMQSRMTINRHVDMAGAFAANIRLFEATGCGTLLFTEKKKNLGEFFRDGNEVVSYTGSDDLCDKIRYYSDHPKERDAIAAAGQKRTLKDHTYAKRMKHVIQTLQRFL